MHVITGNQMALLPRSVQSGQSNAPQYSQPTQFVQQGYNTGFQGNVIGTLNPTATIDAVLGGKTIPSAAATTFPSDIGKYHAYIIESEIVNPLASQTITDTATITRSRLDVRKTYRLPLPQQLNREYEVNYDTNFNYLSVLGNLSRIVGSAAGQAAASGLGLAINTFKSVTLGVPDFQTFQLSWKMSPKTFQEARTIQRIITSLQEGMHPEKSLAGFVLGFPRVFQVGIVPNAKFLMKFKPSVISSMKVDYQGGQPVPSFYATPQTSATFDFGSNRNPPESVLLSLNFIELEYWLREDFNNSRANNIDIDDGLPTDNPFISNWFTYDPIIEEERGANVG